MIKSLLMVIIAVVVIVAVVGYVNDIATERGCGWDMDLVNARFNELLCNCSGKWTYGGYSCLNCTELCKLANDSRGQK